MTKSLYVSACSFAILLYCFAGLAWTSDTTLTVEDPAICLDVVNHSCVDPNDVFPASVGKLFCYTKIIGAETPVGISHVWFFGDVERARIPLAVRSARFRTFSSKRIQAHEIGNWRVDVLGPEDTVLSSISFEMVP